MNKDNNSIKFLINIKSNNIKIKYYNSNFFKF